MRRLILMFTAGLCSVLPAGAASPRTPILRFPNPFYRSLQEALDAAPDGAMVQIAPGVYDLAEPLQIAGKRLTIQGAGSGIPDRRGRVSAGVTHLRGPRPPRAVDRESARGGISCVGGGGVLRNLKVTGFDAGVTSHPDGRGAALPLRLHDVAISDATFGVVWASPAKVTISSTTVKQIYNDGLLILNGKLLAFGIEIHDVGSIGLYLTSPVVNGIPEENVIIDAHLLFCSIGIVVFQTAAGVYASEIALCGGGGIWAVYAELWAFNNWISSCGGVGIGGINAFMMIGLNEILDVGPIDVNGNPQWGDGIAVIADQFPSIATIVANTITECDRAGISVFGSEAHLGGNTINDTAFPLDAEPYKGYNCDIENKGGNTADGGPVIAASANLAPPELTVP